MTPKKIVWIVIAVILVAGVYYWWRTNSDNSALSSGNVISHDSGADSNTKARMDSGAVELDGRPMNSYADNSAVSNQPPRAPIPPTVVQSNTFVPQPATATPASLPTSDTLSPNAPNGMAFGGSGRFQWYRQGNITWRINTQTGDTCVAFATMEEWAKPIVYTHGCNNA